MSDDTFGPWSAAWTAAGAGAHAIAARVYDDTGGVASSSPVTVNVQVPSVPGEDVVLWAADAPFVAGWTVTSDSTAAGGAFLQSADLGVAKLAAPLASPAKDFELTFNALAGRGYRLWIRGKAQGNSYANDSAFVQFDHSVTNAGVPQDPDRHHRRDRVQHRGLQRLRAGRMGLGRRRLRHERAADLFRHDRTAAHPRAGARGRARHRPDRARPPGGPLPLPARRRTTPSCSPGPTCRRRATRRPPSLSTPLRRAARSRRERPSRWRPRHRIGRHRQPRGVPRGRRRRRRRPLGAMEGVLDRGGRGTHAAQRTVALSWGGVGTSSPVSIAVQVPVVPGQDIVAWAADSTMVSGWTRTVDPTAAGGARLQSPDLESPSWPLRPVSPARYFELTVNALAGGGVPAVDPRAGARQHLHERLGVRAVRRQRGPVRHAGLPDRHDGRHGLQRGGLQRLRRRGLGLGRQRIRGERPAQSHSATDGPQRIRVQVREDGLGIDQVVLSSSQWVTKAPGATKNDTVVLPKTDTQ